MAVLSSCKLVQVFQTELLDAPDPLDIQVTSLEHRKMILQHTCLQQKTQRLSPFPRQAAPWDVPGQPNRFKLRHHPMVHNYSSTSYEDYECNAAWLSHCISMDMLVDLTGCHFLAGSVADTQHRQTPLCPLCVYITGTWRFRRLKPSATL
jgi:hypothetical protein